MKISIAGSRHFIFLDSDVAVLDRLMVELPINEVHLPTIPADAPPGTGTEARAWALKRGLPVVEYEGYSLRQRGRAIIKAIDVLVSFPGGITTKTMEVYARKGGIMLIKPREDGTAFVEPAREKAAA